MTRLDMAVLRDNLHADQGWASLVGSVGLRGKKVFSWVRR